VGEDRGGEFALKNHGAEDIRGYDVVKDIAGSNASSSATQAET